MKYILALLLLATITSCGVGEKVCPRDGAPMLCNALVGEELQNRVDQIEDNQKILVERLNDTNRRIYYVSRYNYQLALRFDAILADLRDKIETNEDNIEREVDALYDALLQLENSVAEQIYPCGNNGPTNEVVIRLFNGHYLGVYKKRGKFGLFTLIEGVTYTTTDGTGCQFEVIAGEIEEV